VFDLANPEGKMVQVVGRIKKSRIQEIRIPLYVTNISLPTDTAAKASQCGISISILL